MKRVTQLIGSVVVGLSLVGLSGAAAWAALEGNPSSSSAAVLSGKIASVDLQHNLLKVKTGLFKRTEFLVKETTKISDGAKDIRLEDLKPGDQVTVSFDNADGKRVISSLMVNNGAAQLAPDQSVGAQSEHAQPPAEAQPQPEQAQPPTEGQPEQTEPSSQPGSQSPSSGQSW